MDGSIANTAKFNISVVGDKTGEKWFGEFEVYTVLPHRLFLQRDRLRRDYLGSYPDSASRKAQELAYMLSDFKVSIIKSPNWFVGSNFGEELADDNVLATIWNNIAKAQGLAEEEDKKATESDAKVLKKAVEEPDNSEDKE